MSIEPSNDRIAKWLRLHLTDQIGPITFAKLRERFKSIDDILQADASEIARVPRISLAKARHIVSSRDKIDVDQELELAEKLGVRILTLEDNAYPRLLRQITDPPPVLYVWGELNHSDELAVAVVGSRNCSRYGNEQASRLGHLLAAAGFTVVSGLARGIDAAGHRGALAADGRTIGVQGRGLAEIYPPENKELAQQISQKGAVISELPLRFAPLRTTFPARNRIISGLSLGTIVVEARPRSGALITARMAVEQNREVMAVPGQIDAPGSAGPHILIKEGAQLVQGIDDILDTLGHIGDILKDHARETTATAEASVEPSLFDKRQIPLTEAESSVTDFIDHEPIHIDYIISGCHMSPAQVNAAVTSLQLKGLIKQLPGSYYQKRR